MNLENTPRFIDETFYLDTVGKSMLFCYLLEVSSMRLIRFVFNWTLIALVPALCVLPLVVLGLIFNWKTFSFVGILTGKTWLWG